MISWCPEGGWLQPGWNIRLSWRDFEVSYIEADIRTLKCKGTRVRWRWFIKDYKWGWIFEPRSFWLMQEWDLLESYLFDRNWVVISREDWEDEIKRPRLKKGT